MGPWRHYPEGMANAHQSNGHLNGFDLKSDPTLDPKLTSFVESAQDAGPSPAGDFPIQNLPYCAFHDPESGVEGGTMVGVAIGDRVVALPALEEDGFLSDMAGWDEHDLSAVLMPDATDILELEARKQRSLRQRLSELLRSGSEFSKNREAQKRAMFKMSDLVWGVPVAAGNYTDFYASVYHATNVGSMFRPDQPLLPNYKHIPIGYHGRASSIVATGTDIPRPVGQQSPTETDPNNPVFGPCKMLDYELEVGAVIGMGNALGKPITIGRAHEHLAGLVLLNDWSARDVQKWEYQPLGPFLAKNFATTLSPFVVTAAALAPFRCGAFARAEGDPQPLPYLTDKAEQERGGFDVTLEVYLLTKQMKSKGLEPQRISRGNLRDMYWTFGQMIAHHTVNGCNLMGGDVLGSGTVSGPTVDSRGCLLELTWDGPGKPRKPIALSSGESRTFLQDGDEVIFRGFCEREGVRRIGFGECRGVVG